MNSSKISTGVCAGLFASAVALAEGTAQTSSESVSKPSASPSQAVEKSQTPQKSGGKSKGKQRLTFFEGCGRKDKDGNWAEFYSNCDTEVDGREVPAPPCKDGWAKVREAVPRNMVSHLEKCLIEL